MAQFLLTSSSFAPNWAGLALIVLALVLLVHELHVPTYGVLTVGAMVLLATGLRLLLVYGNSDESLDMSPLIMYAIVGSVGLIGLALAVFAARARRLSVTNGPEGMIGSKVTAITALSPEGRVRYGGENWAAVLEYPASSADPGSELVITAIEGLRLHVRLAPTYPPIETCSGSLPK